MSIIIKNRHNISGFGFRMVENDVHYKNISFILKYVKEAVFPFMFRNGTKDFSEILTNYSQPELRPYFLMRKGETLPPENERKYTSKGLTAYINAIQNFEMNNRKGMQNLPVIQTAYDPLTYQNFFLRDNLLTMSYSKEVYKYNIDIAVHTGTSIKIHELANFLYSRVHIGKMFYLHDKVNLNHIIDEEIIKLLRMIYRHETDEDFDARLSRITGGKIFRQIDGTTGNPVTFVDIRTNPIITVSNINTDERGANISLEMEISLPSRIWLSSAYTLEELLRDIMKDFEFPDLDGIPLDDIEKILNFVPETLRKYWWLMTRLTKEIIAILKLIDKEKLQTYVDCMFNSDIDDKSPCSDVFTPEEFETIKGMDPKIIVEYLLIFKDVTQDQINGMTIDEMWDIIRNWVMELIKDIEKSKFIPRVDINTLNPDYIKLVGTVHPGFPRLEKILLSVDAHDSKGSMPVNMITKTNPLINMGNETFEKLTSFMSNRMFDEEEKSYIEITDSVFKEVVLNDKDNYKMVVTRNNVELVEGTDYTVRYGNYSVYIHSVGPTIGGIYMIDLFRKKIV